MKIQKTETFIEHDIIVDGVHCDIEIKRRDKEENRNEM